MSALMVFLICAVILFILIPWEFWKVLLWVGVVLAVGWVGFIALMMVLIGL